MRNSTWMLFVLVAACGESKSNLEKASEQQAAAKAAMPEVFASLPAAAEAPPGVPRELWLDLGWFPAGTASITGFPPGSLLSFVEWLRGIVEQDAPDCVGALAGIDRYYMVADEAHAIGESKTQTLVFYGKMDRTEIERCARKMLERAGESMANEGALTILGSSAPHYVAWAQRGTETIAVYDQSRERLDGFITAGPRLDRDTALIEVIRRAPFDTRTWTLGIVDFGINTVGVPSVGHFFTLEFSGTKPELKGRLAGELYFTNSADAERAASGAEALAREIAAAGIDVQGNAVAEADALVFDVSVGPEMLATTEGMQSLLELLERRASPAK